jgi:hypothetical protein
MKRNLFICLLIIYLSLYYYFNYYLTEETKIQNQESNKVIENKVVQPMYITLNENKEKIKRVNFIEDNTNNDFFSKPYYVSDPNKKYDEIENFISNCSSSKNIRSNYYNPKADLNEHFNKKENFGMIRNSDGSEYIDYNYTPNMIEGFGNTEDIKDKYPPMKTPRNIWVYWENINRTKYPTFIKLCMDTMKRHLGTKYNLIFLNEKTIHEYLPDLRKDFENLKIAQKVDYYRIELLYKYGGIWIDADIIMMQDLEPIFKKLDEGYDFVGFGCTGVQCSNGKFRPSNWVLASRPNGVLMKTVLNKLDEKLNLRDKAKEENDETYHDYGKIVLWQALDDLKPNGYDYYHFTSEYDGTRDINKNWVHTPNFFKSDPTPLLDENKLLFVVLYNSEISDKSKLHWIRDCEQDKLIYSDLWIGSLYRKALGII